MERQVDTKKILVKIQKLLALAGNNNNEAEVDSAMQKVQELLTQYNLTLQDVKIHTSKQSGDSQYVESDPFEVGGTLNILDQLVVWLCMEAYDVAGYATAKKRWNGKKERYERYRTQAFVGREMNVIVATQMYPYFKAEFQRRWLRYHRENGLKGNGARKAFMYGAYKALNKKIQDSKKKVEESMAMVLYNEYDLINDWMNERHDFKSGNTASLEGAFENAHAAEAGKKAGQEISINGQMSGDVKVSKKLDGKKIQVKQE